MRSALVPAHGIKNGIYTCVKCWKKVCDDMIYKSRSYSVRQIEERVGVMYFVLMLLAL